jgi:hypothetical protein
MKELGAIAFPKIPTPAEQRLAVEAAIREAEDEKGPYLSLVVLRQHPAWKEIQAGIKAGRDAAIAKGMKADGNDVYRFQGEFRAWQRFLTMADRAAEIIRELDLRIEGLRKKLEEFPTT